MGATLRGSNEGGNLGSRKGLLKILEGRRAAIEMGNGEPREILGAKRKRNSSSATYTQTALGTWKSFRGTERNSGSLARDFWEA